jgi:hypothetical protein
MFWTTPKGRAAKPRTYVRGTGFAAEGVCSEERETSKTNVLTERMQVIARE